MDESKSIRTERLLLRGARENDLDDFHAMLTNDEVMKYWSGPPFMISQTESYLKNMISSSNNGISDFVIVLLAPSDPAPVIGKLGVWLMEKGEVGFMLNRTYWGRGYMAEAFSALLGHLWSGKGGDVRTLTADVDPRNTASLGILKKFGFRETGYEKNTIETHLGWCDSIYLAMDNPRASVRGNSNETCND